MIGRSFFAVVGTFFSITPALVYLVAGGSSPTARRRSHAGTIVAFTTLQSRLFFPIGSMLQVSTEVHSSLALFDRIFEYLDLRHDIEDAPDAVALDPATVRGTVELRDVRFRYDDLEERFHTDVPERRRRRERGARAEWTLDDVSMRVEPGQLAALVGPSGAGKTTITYLVPRLYDVQQGSVTIDGRDVRGVTLESLGDNIGVVTQETYLFHTTIRRQPAVRAARCDAGRARGGSARGEHPRPDRRAARRATTPSWGSAATSSRAARSSGSPSRA